jgi:hypothetical protein
MYPNLPECSRKDLNRGIFRSGKILIRDWCLIIMINYRGQPDASKYQMKRVLCSPKIPADAVSATSAGAGRFAEVFASEPRISNVEGSSRKSIDSSFPHHTIECKISNQGLITIFVSVHGEKSPEIFSDMDP